MSMKIDGQRPQLDADAARRLEAAKTSERLSTAQAAKPAGVQGDRVEVSSDVQLIAAAVQAAHDAPSIRPEAVERGRRALELGTLGADTDQLANRIIDALLKD